MNRIVHLDSGEIFPLDHYGIGTEPLRDAVRDVIALYLTNTSPVDVEKAFIDGSSFVIETHYDQSDLTHNAGEVDICEDYASYIVAGSVVDKGNGLVIVTMGKAISEKEQLIAARTMEELPAAFAGEPDALDYIDEAVENARKDLDELGLGGLLGSGETEG